MSDPLLRIRQLEGEAMAKDARIQHPLPTGLATLLRELRADMAAMGILEGSA